MLSLRQTIALLAISCVAIVFSGKSLASETEALDIENEDAVIEVDSYTGDVWERIRKGFRMPTLTGRRVTTQLRIHERMPQYIERMAQRSSKYLYHIVEEVEKRNLPTELALLPFVESAFQPEALSYAKASGLWQFTAATGNIYSLQQNLWKDDRRDVLESTRAALDYLEKLYAQFGDWQLALAAYNWGEGSVARAIRRAKARGLPADYSHLRMPRETANYVPKLEAIKRIVLNPEKYGIKLPEIDNEPYFVQLTKQRDISVETAADLAEMDPDEFRQLNPGFNLPVIVANHNSSFLLPLENLDVFLDNLASWVDTGKPLSSWKLHQVEAGETTPSIAVLYNMTEEELLRINHIPKGRKVLAGSALLVAAAPTDTEDIELDALQARLALSAPEVRRVVYRVRKGDTVSSIADKYGISQASIRKTNRLRTSMIRVGQRLVLTIPPKAKRTRRIATAKHNTHVVHRGQTLYEIAKQYKTSIANLRKLNDLDSVRIYAGQQLRIR
ncbi:MAG TPA: lytic transglycosylase [Sutterella sp.]|nr:lytic transglycosylase [Sutterella sp.]